MSGTKADRETLRQWDRSHVWHPFTQMAEYEPLLIERAHGCTLVDIDGREYLDGTASLWCNVHGHRHPRIDTAIRDQLDRVAHTTALGASNPTTVRLAKRLIELAPRGLEQVFFSDDGATAIEVALKMAFQYWRQRRDPRPTKTAFAALGDAYHGDTLGSVSVGGVQRFHAMFAPLLFDVVRLPSPNVYRRPPGVSADAACAHYLAEAERLLAAEHERLAAIVVEPLMQCAAGMIAHPPGYLRGLATLARRYDVLLVADEVAVGFGRTGTLFACEQEQVTPDFLCLAKGLTGGYLPMAATLTTPEIYQAFLGVAADNRQFFHGHTYGGNPLAAAAAVASLEIFDEERTLWKLRPKIARLGEHLARLAAHRHIGDVRQCGLAAGIELVRDQATGEPFAASERRGWRVCLAARSEGVLIRPLGDTIVVMPPLSISLEELDRLLFAIERAMTAVLLP
ncbi:MAG TPA: adenosylmethionine--8-amino-7-oxononanoate transaminase [Pirellulales bacterium]|nr:adenosylmethionine--8-amino-7-oxononanoate transaminase [Pirellulales bacterium]